jgi:hypothetical protein
MSDLAEQILSAAQVMETVAQSKLDIRHLYAPERVEELEGVLRRCAADREIVELYVDAKRISTNGWRKANAGGRITDAEAQEVMQADNELDVLDTVLEILARGYGIQP